MTKIRVLQIGTGGFGESWLRVVNSYPETELVAAVDIQQENLQKAGKIAGLSEESLFRSIDEALEKVSADLALIVTPPPSHKDLAMKALKAGLHVMLEKPLAHTYEEAVDLLEFSRYFDRKVMISQNYRWRSPIQTIKKLLLDGTIGKPGYVEYQFRKAFKFGGWRDHYSEILLEDMAIHHFDILRYILGSEPEEVIAQSFRPSWSWFAGNPAASVFMRFSGDIYVNYFGCWVSRGNETTWNGDIRIVGEKGAIEMINDEIQVWLGDATGSVETRKIALHEMPYDDRTTSLDHMVKAIKENRIPQTSIEDNFRSFQLTCAAIYAAKSGRRIKITNGKVLDPEFPKL
ncbi:Gfo/Idh/MocA family protein [Geobacillus zalihae]|uniref:Gfo/Idh/MocA family protein n=1 Tax=Geobacillus zalihae TaxID=213419 RepID=UPI0009BD0507|nr:Gfo/Idh/MocA family oxidoreductase [Geobacillus zalihae]OQP13056.1 hypothetical protein B1693_17005 [Geobacillus zalihae]